MAYSEELLYYSHDGLLRRINRVYIAMMAYSEELNVFIIIIYFES